MSGIFAYTGKDGCRDYLLDGLERLSSRGNEICGIAIKNDDDIELLKTKGAPPALREKADSLSETGNTGIAECANASRCRASAITACPAANKQYAAAIDGEIENFEALRRWAKSSFPVATDEDLLLSMLNIMNNQSKLETVSKIASSLEGAPNFAFISSDEDCIYCHSGANPLVIGIGDEGIFLSSELYALIPFAKRYFRLESGENARITADRANVYDMNGRRIKKNYSSMPVNPVFENGFDFSNELFCCPLAVKDTLGTFIKRSSLTISGTGLKRIYDKTKRIILTGEGSSYYASLLAANSFQVLCDIPSCAHIAGELRYSSEIYDKSTLLIAVSLRGEEENTIACVKRAQSFGAKVIAVTSSSFSYLASLADETLNPNCDFTSSGVSLRDFSSSLLSLIFLALFFGRKAGIVSELYLSVSLKLAEMLPGKVSYAVKSTPQSEAAAKALCEREKVFLTGLCTDYPLALEGAQKIRRIAKINARAFPLSELADESADIIGGSLIFALITEKELLAKALSKVRRLKSLGAEIIILTTANIEEEITDFENIISFSDSVAMFNKIICAAGIYKIAVSADEIKNKSSAEEAV